MHSGNSHSRAEVRQLIRGNLNGRGQRPSSYFVCGLLHQVRTPLALGKDAPLGRVVQRSGSLSPSQSYPACKQPPEHVRVGAVFSVQEGGASRRGRGSIEISKSTPCKAIFSPEANRLLTGCKLFACVKPEISRRSAMASAVYPPSLSAFLFPIPPCIRQRPFGIAGARHDSPFCDGSLQRWRIAVGTLITERPPHRTERAQFGHSAPTSGA